MTAGGEVILKNVEGTENPEYKVLASILAKHSDYFNGLFSSGMRDSCKKIYVLPSLSDEGLAAVHWFLTRPPGDGPNLTTHNMESILQSATYLQIQDMIDWIIAEIKVSIYRYKSFSLALPAYDLGVKYGISNLSSVALEFLCDKFEMLSNTADFLSLDEELLCRLLSSDSTNVSREFECFKAMMRWFLHQVHSRKIKNEELLDVFQRLLVHIRFYMMGTKGAFNECKSLVTAKRANLDETTRNNIVSIIDNIETVHLDPKSIHKETPRKRLRCGMRVLLAIGGMTRTQKCTNKLQFIQTNEIYKPLQTSEDEQDMPSISWTSGSSNVIPEDADFDLQFAEGRPTGLRLPRAASEHCVGVIDGCLLIVGGQYKYSYEGKYTTNAVHKYNPYTKTWSSVSVRINNFLLRKRLETCRITNCMCIILSRIIHITINKLQETHQCIHACH